jgi:hypothetical protein
MPPFFKSSLFAVTALASPAFASEAEDSSDRTPIVVTGTPDRYRSPETSSATKTRTPILDIPQSITILTKQQLEDRNSLTLNQALTYVPGVTVAQGEGQRDQITIRGQSTTADFYTDGVRDDAQLVAQMKARRDRPPPRAAFDEQSWTELLRTSVGEAEAKDFAATVLGGGEANLPEDLLGPCFRASTAKVSTRELGFDLDATLDGATRVLVRFDPRGPAAAAGAREGDLLVEVAYLKGNVALTLLRDGKETKLTYAPKTRTATARAFVRIAGKSDDACGLMLGR